MAAVSSSSSSTTHLFHHLFRRPPTPKPLLLHSLLTPFYSTPSAITTTSNFHQRAHLQKSKISSSPLFFSHSLSTSFPSSPSSSPKAHNFDSNSLTLEEEEEEGEVEIEDGFEEWSESESEESEMEGRIDIGGGEGERVGSEVGLRRNTGKAPTLSVKEKKELASYAHGLGKKLKCQLVGKSGITENLANSFSDNLEANELLKIKIHKTCPGELKNVVQQLEEATGSVAVGQIGRTVIIYRPSLAKLKAEEKKRQNSRVFVRKAPKMKSVPSAREPPPRRSSRRGHRGSSRMQTTSA